jgi:oligosaccharide repeat unit polymerase
LNARKKVSFESHPAIGGGVRSSSLRIWSTLAIACGVALTYLMLPSENGLAIFSTAAIGMGVALGAATAIEATAGVQSLIRVDLLMLWIFYGLTFYEFLFPQPNAQDLVSAAGALDGTSVVLLGFLGLVLGRHLTSSRAKPDRAFNAVNTWSDTIFLLFVVVAILGYLHILVAVNFDVLEMLRQMALPRFSQSWGRGRLGGDLNSILIEVGALINLIPPIAGFIYSHAREYKFGQKLTVTIVLGLTYYYAFASGTRNVFATYIITFVGCYLLSKPHMNWRRALLFGLPMLAVLAVGTYFMLEFRSRGLGNFSFTEDRPINIFVDYNMINISRLTEVFPNPIGFLGFEIPYNAIIRPIPRLLWPGKPEGLSTGIEDALGAGDSVTLSCTFVGEAYMSYGFPAVLIFSLLFGAAAERWNRVGAGMNPRFARVVYASGFLCAAVGMRSMLTTIALWLFGKVWLSRSSRPAGRLVSRNNPETPDLNSPS